MLAALISHDCVIDNLVEEPREASKGESKPVLMHKTKGVLRCVQLKLPAGQDRECAHAH
jgi:hypothetical protein